MTHTDISATLEFKRNLERDFEAKIRIDGRSHYSALYSLPQQCPVMWINLNPGGTPEQRHVLSDEQLARGQHEFWHGDGKTSRATGAFLQRLFETPSTRLRSIQGTNVAWERSRAGKDIDLRAAAQRAAPFLLRYIQYVRPTTMIFGGSAAFELFIAVHDGGKVEVTDVLMGNWGRSQARIFMAATLEISTLGTIKALTVSHPSRGIREGVLERCRAQVADLCLPHPIAVPTA